jgi:signal transduction histidine kinase
VLAQRLLTIGPRAELTFLFAASCAVVLVLVLAIAATGGGIDGGGIRTTALTVLVVGLLAGGLLLQGLPTRAALPRDLSAFEERMQVAGELRTLRTVIEAEQQTVIFWDRGQPPRVLSHTLSASTGVPDQPALITQPGLWLEASSAIELEQALRQLVRAGTPFTILVSTTVGVPLEADGRAAGGRAILRLRGLAGFKRDVARLIDQHRGLKREALATRSLLDAIPMPIWLSNADGRIRWANDAYVKATGAGTRADVTDGTVDLLDTRQRRKLDAALSAGATFRERLPLIVDGAMKPYDVVVVPAERLAAGIGINAALVEDVQAAVARQTAAYDRTLHRVATGIAIYDREQRLTFFNEAYRKIWELDANWLGSKPSVEETIDRLRQLNRLPAVPSFRDWKAKVLTGPRGDAPYEDWWHLADGRTIHVMAELRPDGGATYLFDDVTEQFSQQSRVQEMLETRTETLNSLREGVAVFRPDGCLDLHNPVFAKIWRLSHDRLRERPHVEEIINACQPLYDHAPTWAELRRAVTAFTERRTLHKGQMVRRDDSVIDYAITPLPDGGTLVTFADVTDRRRYEQALEERNQALAQADIEKNSTVGALSYELRTPLNVIVGYTDMLRAQPTLTEDQRRYLDNVIAASRDLQRLIDDMLDLKAIDTGGLELKIAPTLVRPIVDAAVRSVSERAKAVRVTIEVNVAAEVEQMVADAGRVRHVLYHLLSNAIGFSAPDSRVGVRVWRENSMVAFAVSDTGVGVPVDRQAKVFDRFESSSQGSRHRGAGNGLAIVKSLVELHGGNVAFHSEPGRGTEVTVRFPEGGLGL